MPDSKAVLQGADGPATIHALQKPAKAPIGSEADRDVSEGLTALVAPPWRSACRSFLPLIIAKFQQGFTAQRIYQDLVAENAFEGSYYSVCRYVRRLRHAPALPFRRMESPPGEEAQVDFGTAAPVVDAEGRRRRPYVFRIVLSHSRKAYSEVVPRQTTEAFFGCLENAFWHFGGVPKLLRIDDLRAAVTRADWYEPDLNHGARIQKMEPSLNAGLSSLEQVIPRRARRWRHTVH